VNNRMTVQPRLLLAALALHWLAAGNGIFAEEPSLQVVTGPDGKPAAVVASGFSEERLKELRGFAEDDARWTPTLGVYVKKPNGGSMIPALAGQYVVVGNAVRFTPRFSFSAGVKYSVCLTVSGESPPSAGAKLCQLDIAIPAKAPGEPAKVTAIYPSSAVLPENQLRFYVHFSKPMRQGEAYGHIKLLKGDGQPDTRAFFDVGEELWDYSGTRLTLFFHPGRVKRGLQPREEFGPVLEAGKSYSLVIDKAWRDAEGQPLAAAGEKRFEAGPPIESAIETAQWKVTPPKAGTREPLILTFPQPLDRALMQRMITVESGGKSIDGEIAVADEERRWEFRPEQAWAGGEHSLIVDTTLEDTAGNRIGRPFEVDVFPVVEKRVVAELVRIPFVVGK
jgi:hypothetical protein